MPITRATLDDSAIRSEGAELYVQAYLMLEFGLLTSKASRNMPGYDILVHNLAANRSCRIQVKYRKAIDSDGMRIHNLDFDFAVYVAGNKGFVGESLSAPSRCEPMAVFVIPVEVIRAHPRKRDLYDSPTFGDHEPYRDAWHLINEFLARPSHTTGAPAA